MRRFSPRKRITVEGALNHPYVEPYHDPNDEPGARPLRPEFFDFERKEWEDNESGRAMLKSQLTVTYYISADKQDWFTTRFENRLWTRIRFITRKSRSRRSKVSVNKLFSHESYQGRGGGGGAQGFTLTR